MTFSPTHDPRVLFKPRGNTSPRVAACFNQKEKSQNWNNALKFVRGKKLLKDLCTWGIGGPCNYFLQVSNQTQLVSAIRYCREQSIRYITIGKGSNCLFDDLGFNGCVILNRIEFLDRKEHGVYRVGSGFRFNSLGMQCCIEGFTGLEFAAGVPGTVGGATYMNAGANGQETGDVIDSVDIVTLDGKLQTVTRNDLIFGYRLSSFRDMNNLAAIVGVTFRLQESSANEAWFHNGRRMTQPLGDRTAGSVFRNPADIGVTAAALIEKAGLKGFRVGGAMVSNVHANFFVNAGGSTSTDMLNLIGSVKEKIDQHFGVQLKEEVLYFDSQCNYLNRDSK